MIIFVIETLWDVNLKLILEKNKIVTFWNWHKGNPCAFCLIKEKQGTYLHLLLQEHLKIEDLIKTLSCLRILFSHFR